MNYVNSDHRLLKRQALQLLEWTMEDMSPENGPKLSLKCGLEREGHFLPDIISESKPPTKDWLPKHCERMTQFAKELNKRIQNDPCVKYVTPEMSSGIFIIEGVTKPLGLVEAAEAMERISIRMIEEGNKIGLSTSGFGSVSADSLIEQLGREYVDTISAKYALDLLYINLDPFLIGREQHSNLTICLNDTDGDTNLFRRHSSSRGPEILHNATECALEWLPHMFLPYRHGNYHRLNSKQTSYRFFATDLPLSDADHGDIARYKADDPILRKPDPNSYRLEFRHATPEADPFDVVLATAAPLVHACDKQLQKVNGKVVVNNRRVTPTPVVKFPEDYTRAREVPKTEDEAKDLFNRADNPYFIYLDELAKRRIAKAQARTEEFPDSAVYAEELRQALKFENLAGDLHAVYCKEYGLESKLEGPTSTVNSRG